MKEASIPVLVAEEIGEYLKYNHISTFTADHMIYSGVQVYEVIIHLVKSIIVHGKTIQLQPRYIISFKMQPDQEPHVFEIKINNQSFLNPI